MERRAFVLNTLASLAIAKPLAATSVQRAEVSTYGQTARPYCGHLSCF